MTATDHPALLRRPGMIAMIVGVSLLPVGDTLSKLLTQHIPALEVTMWRLVAQAILLAAIAAPMWRRLEGRMFSPIVLASGGLIAVTLSCLIGSFAAMPIATAIAIFFVEPLVLTVLAGPLLGEVAGPRRYAAVAVGLVGALIVIRPSFADFGWAALLPLGAAVTFALNMIVMRVAGRTRSPLTIQTGAAIYAALILSATLVLLRPAGLPGPAVAAAPGWALPAIAASGLLAATSFVLIAGAFRSEEASLLAPFQYLEIVGATIMGYLVFGDFPDVLTWLGTAIILGSGIYVFHREAQAG